jgi:hypothetical protein
MRDEERVIVTTAKGRPSFLVHRKVSEQFISVMVRWLYGKQGSGEEHEWESIVEVEEQEITAN